MKRLIQPETAAKFATFSRLFSGGCRRLNQAAIVSGMVLVLWIGSASGAVTYYWDGSQANPNTGSDPHLTTGNISAVNGGPTLIYTGSSAPSDYTDPAASGGDNFQARDPGSDPSVTSMSTYFTVTLTPDAGYRVALNSLSLGTRSTGSGPTAMAVYSSIDDYTTAIGTVTGLSTSGSWVWKDITFEGDSLAGLAGQAVTMRLYGYGGTGSSSSYNWHIDDIRFTVANDLAAVPERDEWGLIAALGLLLICALHETRRHLPGKARAGG